MKTHLNNCSKYLRLIIGLIIIIISTILISGCTKESNSNLIICNLEEYSLYPKVIEKTLPTFKIEQSENKPYDILNNGGTVEAFDTQAVGAIDAGIAKYWYPQYLATVIIAVDRDQTDVVVNGWNDLPNSKQEIGLFNPPGNIEMLIAAMSFGLEGKDYSLEKTLQLLGSLHDRNSLKVNSMDTPIIICYDYQAAGLIKNSRNIEIIVPKEGTFTYEKGLLSNKELSFKSNLGNLLLESKLRLLDGEGDSSIYPDRVTYDTAEKITDYKHFSKTTNNVTSLIERKVFNSKKFMSIDNREHFYIALAYIIIITIWISSILRRSTQKSISYAVFFTGIILNSWILVRLIKYQVKDTSIFNRYLWYSFYIFQLSLPLVLLWMAWAIDKPEKETFPPKWFRNLAILIGALIILVFTNDIHGLVFHLDLSKQDWATNYSYGFAYYIILFTCMMNLFGVFFILIKKGIRNPRKKSFILPLATLATFVIYNYKYIKRDPFVYETDITIITGIFTMLMFETSIHSGLIPVNTKYIELFKRSPLKMQIINNKGKTVFASTFAKPLDKDIIGKVLDLSPVSIFHDESILISNSIPGGNAISNEDVSKLYQLHREIEKSTKILTEANAILIKEEKIKRSINEGNLKRKLMEQLESEIAESIVQLSVMIEKLSSSQNHSKEITSIALLLCYIKRRCNLFFQEKETNILDVKVLNLYMDELTEIAKYSNIEIAYVNKVKGYIDIRHATLFYDFFYKILDLSVQIGSSNIIQHFESEKGFITMGLLVPKDIGLFKPDSKFSDSIVVAKGKIIKKDLEDTTSIRISFRKEGVLND